MRKTNTNGNVSVFRFEDNKNYTMADLLYVNSQHNSIERMYNFLQVFYQWTKNKVHEKTAIQVVKDSKINFNILRVMKKHSYIDESNNWLINSMPSKADAVFLRMELRNLTK